MRDDLLQYYENELSFLRRMGAEFAEKYPKIASRLVLEPNKCEDPHVERLLEGVALLAARVHLKVDDEFPEIVEALLNILFPHYLRPIPSMSVAEFQVDSEQVEPETGFRIERGAMLASRPVGGAPCRFRTAYNLAFWPVEVSAAEWKPIDRLNAPGRVSEAVGALRLELRCHGDLTFSRIALDSLRFYLHGGSTLVHTLYEILGNNCVEILVRDTSPGSNAQPVVLPAESIRPVGFEKTEEMLPYPGRSFAGYQLLQEYFSFPQKFFFLDLGGFDQVRAAGFGGRIEVIFLISPFEAADRRQVLESQISARTFRLNCAPIINLFPHTAEPIRLDQARYEYPVVPDVSRRTAMEIFSIESVVSVKSGSDEVLRIEPLYSFRHSSVQRPGEVFWHASRTSSSLRNDPGMEVKLAIANAAGTPGLPDGDTLTVRGLCTNRDLPGRLPFGNEGGDFTLESAAPVKRIIALVKPTAVIRPPLGRNLLWRLLSQLSLNYLSLVDDGLEAFQEILRLYNFGQTMHADNQIDGLVRLESRPHLAPVASAGALFFARGTRVEMEFNEDQFVGGGVYLFSAVLERFLGLYVSLNSFAQLLVRTRQRREVLKLWPPRAGRRILI
jgi:type VI secretion system protein ImpG